MRAYIEGGKLLGTAADELTRAIDERGHLPAGYTYRFAGMYEVMAEARLEFLEAALLAFLLTYLMLATVLESFRQPIIIRNRSGRWSEDFGGHGQ